MTGIDRNFAIISVFFRFGKDVIAIRTPISWVGNKTSILPVIYSRFPLQYDRYIEPFGGRSACAVNFAFSFLAERNFFPRSE